MKRHRTSSENRLYRSRHGVLLGVCRGLADHFNLRVGWVRLLAVVTLLISGVWPVVFIYLIAGLLMKPEPMIPFENEDQRDFYDSYTTNRQGTLRDLKRRFATLDRRLRRMEDTVTSKDFEWEQKFNC